MDIAGPEDSVIRLQAFRAAHPDIDIKPPTRENPFWVASRGGSVLCESFRLTRLLDRLEEMSGS